MTTMESVGVITRPTFNVDPYRHEKSRVAFIPTIQSARSRQRAASYKASYFPNGSRWANPSRIAASSMLEIQSLSKGFRHLA